MCKSCRLRTLKPSWCYIRTAALANRVTYYTTMAGCEAATDALKHQAGMRVYSLQELHAELH